MGAGNPGPDVHNLARKCAPGARCSGGRFPGPRAGCPGSRSEDELEELDFGAEIEDSEAEKLNTIGEVVDYIAAHQNDK